MYKRYTYFNLQWFGINFTLFNHGFSFEIAIFVPKYIEAKIFSSYKSLDCWKQILNAIYIKLICNCLLHKKHECSP